MSDQMNDIMEAGLERFHQEQRIALASLLSQIVGVLLCGIGALFTAAFVYHPTYLIYKEVIGFENDNEVETI